MQEASDSLAGRIGIIEIPTLSASEVESFQGRSIEGPALLDLIWRGGFPELHRDRRQPERFFASYIAS